MDRFNDVLFFQSDTKIQFDVLFIKKKKKKKERKKKKKKGN